MESSIIMVYSVLAVFVGLKSLITVNQVERKNNGMERGGK